MRQSVFIIFIIVLSHTSFAQSQDVWLRYYDSTTELTGYKDLKGNIKIPAKFDGFTRADSFFNIMAVHEKIDSSYKAYYLLKNGRKVGQDSVFMFDFTFDCESEGKIIFYDKKKDRVGFFDKNGTAIIPAIYNYVSPFRNGLAVAHRNAKRKCWEGDDTTRCEHLGWEGGESIIINDKHEIIADNITVGLNNVDWYSKKENASSLDTSIYVSIKAKNNITYSFINYDKEFNKWFRNSFIPSLNSEKAIPGILFNEITFWTYEEGWTSVKKQDFLKAFPNALTSSKFDTNKLKQMWIGRDFLNEYIYEKDIYKKYFNSCGEHNYDRFPLFNILITYYKKRESPNQYSVSEFFRDYDIDYQEHFEFLRTEQGYKLLSVSLKK